MSQELQKIQETIVPILKKYGARKAAIFGSFVRNEQTSESDVDILVDLPPLKGGLFDFIGIKQELEDALHTKVDLVQYKAMRTRLKDNILHSAIEIL